MNIRRRKKIISHEIYPDEILLDARNSPNFDAQQFEGKFEKPIGKRTVFLVATFSIIIFVVFMGRLWSLQITNGAYYQDRSENISFHRTPVFSDRGVIYDRNGRELVWNIEAQNEDSFAHREYINEDGFGHLLGYVSYPSKDASGIFWSTEFSGKDGIEKIYNERLSGQNGVEFLEVDSSGVVKSRHISTYPVSGENITLSVDSRLQNGMYKAISNLLRTGGYQGGAGVLMNIESGEVLALTSVPEYRPKILSDGDDREKINDYINNPKRVFMNRAISGLYTPGSIIKPIMALGALSEGVITPEKKILSTGSISIPNPYFPDQKSIFKDWKAHGWVDMRQALAVSSDVYFYEVGGGFEDQKGIGILNIDKYHRMFGIGEKTGIDLPGEVYGTIPTPEWKSEHFKGDKWRVGDTYNTSIGQYGFQMTPLEITRAIAAIANGGTLVTPHLILGDESYKEKNRKIILPAEDFQVVREGMRQGITSGTSAVANVPFVKVAAKTGTAQIGVSKNRYNSWVVGFFPYDNPKYALTIMAESAPKSNTIGAVYGMKEFFEWMNLNTPEYFN